MYEYTIKAKPLEWEGGDYSQYGREWTDKKLGFCISEDLADAPESRFSASWGESDCECFPSLEAAQAWCQEEIDRFVESIAFIEIHTKDHEVNN